MKKNGTIPSMVWLSESNYAEVIDQRLLPHQVAIFKIKTVDDCVFAIKEMVVRGAPLIGVTAAYGFYLATLEVTDSNYVSHLQTAYNKLLATRPTAVNLKWALDEMMRSIKEAKDPETIRENAFHAAERIREEDIEMCRLIGAHGLKLIADLAEQKKGETVNILTHCNAGRLACVEWGTATSPIYQAHLKGINLHVWVDETRPRNQGAALTAYELGEAGVPHTLIADNTGGLLMQKGMVDMVIVGADRVAANGDVANKIGTYLKALAAKDNNVPFYVAFPFSTVDFSIENGNNIQIERRSENEVKLVQGKHGDEIVEVLICPGSTPALNYGFDITPAHLITKLITDKGIFPPKDLHLYKN